MFPQLALVALYPIHTHMFPRLTLVALNTHTHTHVSTAGPCGLACTSIPLLDNLYWIVVVWCVIRYREHLNALLSYMTRVTV